MKTELADELAQRTDYDSMSEDELRWLKDHNKLPAQVEAKYFRPVVNVGGATVLGDDVPNTGDVDTVDMGVPPELRGTDLSLIDREAEKDRRIQELEAELEQTRMEREALAAGNQDQEEEDDEEDDEEDSYDDMTVEELKAEIDRRNAQRAEDGQEPLHKPGKKADLIDVLEEDDEDEGGE